MRVGLYGTFREAMKALDEQVGLGHGDLDDYEMELVPKEFSTRQVVTKVVAWVFPISLIVACLALAAVDIVAVPIAIAATALSALGAWGLQKIRHRF